MITVSNNYKYKFKKYENKIKKYYGGTARNLLLELKKLHNIQKPTEFNIVTFKESYSTIAQLSKSDFFKKIQKDFSSDIKNIQEYSKNCLDNIERSIESAITNKTKQIEELKTVLIKNVDKLFKIITEFTYYKTYTYMLLKIIKDFLDIIKDIINKLSEHLVNITEKNNCESLLDNFKQQLDELYKDISEQFNFSGKLTSILETNDFDTLFSKQFEDSIGLIINSIQQEYEKLLDIDFHKYTKTLFTFEELSLSYFSESSKPISKLDDCLKDINSKQSFSLLDKIDKLSRIFKLIETIKELYPDLNIDYSVFETFLFKSSVPSKIKNIISKIEEIKTKLDITKSTIINKNNSVYNTENTKKIKEYLKEIADIIKSKYNDDKEDMTFEDIKQFILDYIKNFNNNKSKVKKLSDDITKIMETIASHTNLGPRMHNLVSFDNNESKRIILIGTQQNLEILKIRLDYRDVEANRLEKLIPIVEELLLFYKEYKKLENYWKSIQLMKPSKLNNPLKIYDKHSKARTDAEVLKNFIKSLISEACTVIEYIKNGTTKYNSSLQQILNEIENEDFFQLDVTIIKDMLKKISIIFDSTIKQESQFNDLD